MVGQGQKGFALAITLAILPILISGLLLMSTLIGFIQNDLAMKYHCRTQGLIGQKKIVPLLNSLLALNPLSATLRLQQAKAQQDIATATAAKNPVALALATERYMKILKKREQLDLRQKQLIKQSNLLLLKAHSLTVSQLRHNDVAATSLLLKSTLLRVRGRPPQLAVRPESSDLAPTYSPAPEFENRQALAHDWQYRVQVRPPFSHFLPGDLHFQKACSVTLRKVGSSWIPRITTGRFSLRSVW